MPLSHLTLTVSHLPTSTSFFLSCLQPLGYKFIGRHDEYIGFGSKADEPADFWLAQEQPGTPAGAAHIAFPAPSKEAVNTFFISALKAGGKIHGEPKVRDLESGYFSAAVVDFDGNSIEAVYRPDPGSNSNSNSDIVSLRGGPSALQTSTVKNGSVVSRARSTKTESVMQRDRAVHAIENIPASRVQMLYNQQQQQQQPPVYQPYTTQTQSNNSSNNNSLSAKTIIGTLLGATAGAAIAYAMIKGDSPSSSTSAPTTNSQASMPEPIPMPAQSQYIQQQLPQPQQPQQQSQPQQMSMSLPMLMPMLGPAPGSAPAAFQEQQPIYRALEAPPTAAARSTFTANDAISAYTRSSAGSKNKSPRADTIYEDTEYYPSIEGAPKVINGGSMYSQEPTTMSNGGSSGNGIRRTANGSVYATRELPIRAIEYTSGMSITSQSQSSSTSSQKIRAKSYPCDPSTFISSYAEQQHQQQGHIIGEAESDFSSISTIKPAKSSTSTAHRSSTSSSHTRSEKKHHHSSSNHSSASSHHQSSTSSHRSSKSSSKHHSHHIHHRYPEDELEEPVPTSVYSTSSSRMTAHKISLPESKPGSTYSTPHSSSSSSSSKRGSRYSPHEIPLPESAAPSTIFLDAVDADDSDNIITPDDSISQVGVNIIHENKSSSGRTHRSRSGPSSTPSTTSSRREKESKFDQPLKPSDSISQVSSNIHPKSRVSERSDRTLKAGSKVHSVKSGSRH